MINRIITIDKGLYLIAEVISRDARAWNDLSIPQPGQLIDSNCLKRQKCGIAYRI